MTDNDIKEALSRDYLRAIAHFGRIKLTQPEFDHGEDFILSEVVVRKQGERSRYLDSGRKLSVQMKATTESQIQDLSEDIVYTLEAKTYNDLIFRRNTPQPLFLILFIMPDEMSTWLALDDDELHLRKCAYWFLPTPDASETENSSSINITIPKSQLVSLETWGKLFQIPYS